MNKKMLSAGIWVFIGIVFGRLGGFIRESLIASEFATSTNADIAVLVLTFPDLLLNMLIGGAMGAVLIPEFQRLGDKSRFLLFQAIAIVTVIFVCIAIVLFIHSDLLLKILAPGFLAETSRIARFYLNIVIFSLPITAITAITTAYLQASNKFAISSLGTPIYNTVLIVCLLLPLYESKLLIISAGVIFAAVLRLLLQFANIYHSNKALRKQRAGNVIYLTKPMATRYVQVLFTGGLIFLLPILMRIFSSFGDSGSIAVTNYTLKLVELPLAVCITIFAVVLFPSISNNFLEEETHSKGIDISKEAIQLVSIISFTLILFLIWFRSDLTRFAFGWGKMSEEDINTIAALTAIGFLALPAQGISSLTQAIFIAKKDTRSPFLISIAAVLLFATIAMMLPSRQDLEQLLIFLVITYWLILLGHLVILKLFHKINLISALINKQLVASMIVIAGLFGLTAGLSLLTTHVLINLVLAFGGIIISLLTSLLTITRYRKAIVNIWNREVGHA